MRFHWGEKVFLREVGIITEVTWIGSYKRPDDLMVRAVIFVNESIETVLEKDLWKKPEPLILKGVDDA